MRELMGSGTAPEADLASWQDAIRRTVDDLKRFMIQQAIDETGSKSKAAERLGIPRQSLQKMMKRLGL